MTLGELLDKIQALQELKEEEKQTNIALQELKENAPDKSATPYKKGKHRSELEDLEYKLKYIIRDIGELEETPLVNVNIR